jgi:hypothetical protein
MYEDNGLISCENFKVMSYDWTHSCYILVTLEVT